MRKYLLATIAIAIALAGAGCGGGGGSDEDQVRGVVTSFQQAIVGHDAEGYCDALTSSFRNLATSVGRGTCHPPGGITNIGSESIQTVAITGSTANVALTGGATVKLKQENGDWKVADWKEPETP